MALSVKLSICFLAKMRPWSYHRNGMGQECRNRNSLEQFSTRNNCDGDESLEWTINGENISFISEESLMSRE